MIEETVFERTEKYILASFLTTPETIPYYRSQIVPEAFLCVKCQFICSAIFKRYDNTQSVDLILVCDEAIKLSKKINVDIDFDELLGYMENLVDLFFSNYEQLEEKIKDLNKRYCSNDAVKAGEKITELGFADLNPDELLLEARNIVYDMRANFISNDKNADNAGNIAKLVMEKAERVRNKEEKLDAMLTQYDQFHDVIGPIFRGDFIVLGAVSSMGKTTIALNLLRSLAKNGHRSLIESIEMPKEKLTEKLLSMEARVNNRLIPLGTYSGSQKQELISASVRIKDLDIIINNAQRLTVSKVAMDIHKYKPEIVMIDFLQKMKWSGREKRLGMEKVCDELFALAKETNTTILLLSQLVGKSIEYRPDKRPQMYDLKEAGGITEDADMILMLYNEAFYKKDVADKNEERLLEIIVAKNRMCARKQTL